jgi:hypothetical protein
VSGHPGQGESTVCALKEQERSHWAGNREVVNRYKGDEVIACDELLADLTMDVCNRTVDLGRPGR